MPGGLSAAGSVDQDPAHHHCGGREEVDPVLPVWAPVSEEAKVSLMYEIVGPESLSRWFQSDSASGHPAQMLVNEGQELICRRPISRTDGGQDPGDVLRRCGFHVAPPDGDCAYVSSFLANPRDTKRRMFREFVEVNDRERYEMLISHPIFSIGKIADRPHPKKVDVTEIFLDRLETGQPR